MVVGTYSNDSQIPVTRLEILVKKRALKINGSSSSTEESNGGDNEIKSPGHAISEILAVENGSEGAGPGAVGQESENGDSKPVGPRLLVVANRLQISAIRKGEDSWALETSAGGLVSALMGVNGFDIRWIGWPGVNVPDEVGRKALTKALAEKRSIPVFLDGDTFHQYYNGYCNNILWPLFHYLGLPKEDRLDTTRSFQTQFDAYKRANQLFAAVVLEHYKEGDIIWCHDYHLMFLPKYLKESNSGIRVGWFLHTPFPSSEIHRTLPSRSEVLLAVLAADLIGFHTYDYTRHFLSACTRILGLEGTPDGVDYQGRITRVSAFPIGINPERFTHSLEKPKVQDIIKDLKRRFAGRKVMLGVDRLDMIKGIPQKLLAFEKFLEENPEWREKVVLMQIAVPTRTDVPKYQKLASEVHEIVGRINGRFGTLTTVPIHHLDRSINFLELCAVYAVTDVALVTSLRDGMNLVSYEFVACQNSNKGVLILSEFAGAAQSLGAGALLVNPWNITDVASAIEQALNMPAEEREKRHRINFNHVTTHTAQMWADFFVSELTRTILEAQRRIRQAAPPLVISDAIERYMQSKNRLIILGFNAALTETIESPGKRGDQIKEMELTLHPDVKEPLRILSSDPNTTILILSGSDRKKFGAYDVWLAAENGIYLRSTKGDWMITVAEPNTDWMDGAKHVFAYFTERTPRSCFELREYSLIWNFKYSNTEFGRLQARVLLEHLWTGPISNSNVDVIQGSRSVEVRALGITKGVAICSIISEIHHCQTTSTPIDYVLCLGHFLSKDEDIYTYFEPEPGSAGRSKTPDAIKRLHSLCETPKQYSPSVTKSTEKPSLKVLDLKAENYFSCTVGRTCTKARYMLNSSDDVAHLLKEMAAALQ
ncbi:alpha,alpha-trehalose-phosphate synthase [UDP-forming] 1-like isoform X2 [Andrographis paniculata]|uniref:alpha,alpha-trehalose-phosphate synthase [UDP-forming] 1-like isoform X2 n=1 Tax=Andrographis paniculata TaxID=175694 RepID=UPI0021E8BE23|nr:alpha,alpha-trehalose-phosphate synthase [UDP-forming] 1-like isoform X2 [Andrographis paniculata]